MLRFIWLIAGLALGITSPLAQAVGAVLKYDSNGNLIHIGSRTAADGDVYQVPFPPLLVPILNMVTLFPRGSGEPLRTYQWLHDGGIVLSATNMFLHVYGDSIGRAGRYTLLVSEDASVTKGVVVDVAFRPEYYHFGMLTGLQTVGTALRIDERLRLTESNGGHNGAAWFGQKLFFRNGFTSRFQFRITNPQNGGGDGFAFCLHNEGSAAVAGENGVGAAIKFDTWQNEGEISDNFVSIQGEGIPNAVVDLRTFGLVLDDGSTHGVQVTHNGLTVNVWLDGVWIVRNAPMPLDKALDEYGSGWTGFTARTEAASENHDILSWSFTPNSELALVGVPSTTPTAPFVQILANPASQAVLIGGTAYLAAKAITGFDRYFYEPAADADPATDPVPGDGDLRYEWRFNGSLLPNETGATLVVPNVQLQHAGLYSVAVYNHAGRLTENLLGRATNSLVALKTVPNIFSTGRSAANEPLDTGAPDPHWTLASDSPVTGTPVAPGSATPAYWKRDAYPGSNFPNSSWIAPNLQLSGPLSDETTPYHYETSFSLLPEETNTFRLAGFWSANFTGMDILVNGVSSDQYTDQRQPDKAYPFELTHDFKAGQNTLRFDVFHSGGPETGVRVEMAGTTLASSSLFNEDSDSDSIPDVQERLLFGNLHERVVNDNYSSPAATIRIPHLG